MRHANFPNRLLTDFCADQMLYDFNIVAIGNCALLEQIITFSNSSGFGGGGNGGQGPRNVAGGESYKKIAYSKIAE